jgi:hypothetical protein
LLTLQRTLAVAKIVLPGRIEHLTPQLRSGVLIFVLNLPFKMIL